MRILIIGHTGQLGTDLKEALEGHELVLPEMLDVRDHDKVFSVIATVRPKMVISTAAYHDTLKCKENPEKSFAVNSFATKNLAEACRESDCPLVWISTDMVFSGEEGRYKEDDTPSPVNVYGMSKFLGEEYIRFTWKKHYIVRTNALFGKRGCEAKGGKNFPLIMLGLEEKGRDIKVKDDEYCNPSYTKYLAQKIVELLEEPYGTYHIAGRRMSWYEFAKMFVDCKPVSRDEFPDKIRRGEDTSLAVRDKWLLPVEEGAEEYLNEIGH